MKAEYIVNAIVAMRAMDNAHPWTDPGGFGRALGDLASARIDLEIMSGIRNMDIKIEAPTETLPAEPF